ncbi:carotenoid oxygenase family protein [Nocardia pseudobrasiliensis]|uniref:Dioxygenase n=1 Tax=Nocardia pseudobrasiliensis TaxID=45979 RepID=A0A370I9C8_9NOCA|nr:carotenoid oxygenase family protein [Nocardia pseudobrasiliensis]RDI67230.1 carotenoid cleavage dioxygenase [Nocardia pseudobrasiliensis]
MENHTEANRPPYLSGHFEPTADELTAFELKVHGTLPDDLDGRYFRNGHNPKPGVTPTHWFRGAGMLHGIRLSGGRAQWYRNRWVKTPYLDGVPFTGTELEVSPAATNIIFHAGRYLALQEANLPWEVTGELETVGAYDFGGKLTSSMTAHPKVDPVTGELHFYSYSPFPPYLIYYVADASGEIVRSTVVDGAGPSLMHDFAITPEHAIFLHSPVEFDPNEHSGIPYSWNDAAPFRIGVLPRHGDGQVMWFELANKAAILHVTNSYIDDRGRIVLEAPRFDRSAWETSWKWWVGAPGYPDTLGVGSTFHRWILDPATGTATEEGLDDLVIEFPAINDDRTGVVNRYSYAVGFPGAGLSGYHTVKYDTRTGQRELFAHGPGRMPGEAVFAPAAGATREDDGYLMTIVSDLEANAAQLLILDAADLSEPIAAVDLPQRVPAGIHGHWIPSEH